MIMRRAGQKAGYVSGSGEDAATASKAWTGLYRSIGDFLASHRLEPTPGNYTVAYHFHLRSDAEFVAAVEAATFGDTRLSQMQADQLSARINSRGPLSIVRSAMAEVVSSIDKARTRFERYARIVDASHADAQAYGIALVDGAARLAPVRAVDQESAVATLIGVTETMIEKTRSAESQLRAASREMTELRASLAAARQDAETDALTGLPNRRAFESHLAARIANPGAHPVSLAMCDIDLFKAINDRHGHDVGDRVIRLVARELAGGCGEAIVARYGGEEFVILFDGCEAARAARELDATRAAIARRSFRVKGTEASLENLSFSGGVVSIRAGEPAREAVRRADAALYRAKQAGRNRIELGD